MLSVFSQESPVFSAIFGSFPWRKCHDKHGTRYTALQAFSGTRAGVSSWRWICSACRAFLRVVFYPKWVYSSKNWAREKLWLVTYGLKVVIFTHPKFHELRSYPKELTAP